jgi:hypothetical protein
MYTALGTTKGRKLGVWGSALNKREWHRACTPPPRRQVDSRKVAAPAGLHA